MGETKEYLNEEEQNEACQDYVITVKETSSSSFVQRALEERRNHKPPISFEQMKAELEREVVLYTLEKLRDQGVISQVMYENAVVIALKS